MAVGAAVPAVPARVPADRTLPELAGLRVALAHDWLVQYAGSERVVAEILQLLPQARLLTTICRPGVLPAALAAAETSFLQRVPGSASYHQWLLPLMPLAWRLAGPLHDVDVVVSSSHACAKAIRVADGVPHISYCHTPMRYAWDFGGERARFQPAMRPAARVAMAAFRVWDRNVASRTDLFIANSTAVAERIRRCYGRSALVIHPPVDTSFFTPGGERGSDYLYVGRLVAYKRPDLIVEAFRGLPDLRLKVVGSGPLLKHLRQRATENITFLEHVDGAQLRELYRSAAALVHAGEEDFGIAMAEAQACGTPVIALRAGGALDIVEDGETGILVDSATAAAFQEAVERSETMTWESLRIAGAASRFSAAAFRVRFGSVVAAAAGGSLPGSR